MFDQDDMQQFQMITQGIKMMVKGIAQDDELIKVIAQMSKKMLDAYVAEGFTREEAMQLVTKSNILNNTK